MSLWCFCIQVGWKQFKKKTKNDFMKKLQKPIRNADVHILKNIDDEEKMQVQLGVSERETGTLGSASKFLEYLFNKPIIYTPNAIM